MYDLKLLCDWNGHGKGEVLRGQTERTCESLIQKEIAERYSGPDDDEVEAEPVPEEEEILVKNMPSPANTAMRSGKKKGARK